MNTPSPTVLLKIIVCEHSFINNQDVWTENQIPFSTGGASFPSIQSCCLAHSIPLPVFSEHFVGAFDVFGD